MCVTNSQSAERTKLEGRTKVQLEDVQCAVCANGVHRKLTDAMKSELDIVLSAPQSFEKEMFLSYKEKKTAGCGRTFIRVLLTATVLLFAVFLFFQVRTHPLTYTPLRLLSEDGTVRTSCDGPHRGMHNLCRCPRADRPLNVPPTTADVLHGHQSTCSDHATSRGPNQKLLVFSFYGNLDSKYFNGTKMNVEAVARFYPGWVIRVYHNLSMDNAAEVTALCSLWCENDHLDLCDVRQLPPELCDQHQIFGMLWRFFPLGDPLVERFAVRDIDSLIFQREVDSVNTWIAEDKTWHVMRDNRQHGTEILGGMWGGMNRNLKQNVALRNAFLNSGMRWQKLHDQHLLAKILWPIAKSNMTSHDSYLCKSFPGAKPWPTKRVGGAFVGDAFPWIYGEPKLPECPAACRPADHQDWAHC